MWHRRKTTFFKTIPDNVPKTTLILATVEVAYAAAVTAAKMRDRGKFPG